MVSIKRSLFTLFLLFVLVLTACQSAIPIGPTGGDSEEATPTPLPPSPALVKPTYSVASGEVIEEVTFSGRIVPVTQENLFFKVPGRIRTLYIQEGDQITAGQLLADLEGIDDLQRSKEINDISLRRAEINAEIAQHRLNIFKDTTYSWTTTYTDTLAIQEREVELALLSVQEAQLYSQDLDESLADAQVFAPISGEVIQLDVHPGDNLAAYQVMGVVADTTQLEVASSLLLEVQNKLSPGMSAFIRLGSSASGGAQDELAAKVRRMPTPFSSSVGVSAGQDGDDTTRIAFLDPANATSHDLKIGQLVNVRVVLQQKPDVLWLPPQAIRKFEGRRFVIILDGSLQRRVDIRVGIESETRVEILEGLAEGDVVQGP